jgi:hypothetical protein
MVTSLSLRGPGPAVLHAPQRQHIARNVAQLQLPADVSLVAPAWADLSVFSFVTFDEFKTNQLSITQVPGPIRRKDAAVVAAVLKGLKPLSSGSLSVGSTGILDRVF